jgi:hypothetical protein
VALQGPQADGGQRRQVREQERGEGRRAVEEAIAQGARRPAEIRGEMEDEAEHAHGYLEG